MALRNCQKELHKLQSNNSKKFIFPIVSVEKKKKKPTDRAFSNYSAYSLIYFFV